MGATRSAMTTMAGLFALALLDGGATAWGDGFSVTRSDDPAPGACQPNDCSLREAILAANDTIGPDTIFLQPVTYVVALNGSDTDLTGDLDIRSDLTILCQATIDGQAQGRILDIGEDVNVTLLELVLQNANTSLATNGALNGGAVEIEGGSLTVHSSVFRNNLTQSQGGGIYTRDGAVLAVDDTLFLDNGASSGAAIFVNGDATISDSWFEGNAAELRGAALYVQGTESDVTLERISLIDNDGGGSSGGAVLFLGRDLQVDNLFATGNDCLNGNGGALATTGTAHGKSVRIRQAIFSDNEADNGGALYLADDEDPVDIAHVAFVDNRSERQGGAVYTTGGLIAIANATFSGNSAGTDGGAVHLFGMTLGLRHVTMTGGSANRGSAISIGGSTAVSALTLANSIIDGTCRLADAATLTSQGGNVESPGNTCALNLGSDQTGVSAQALGLLSRQQSAGTTPWHPLTRTSVAQGAGVPAVCEALPDDQLFRSRAFSCSAGAVDGGGMLVDGFETGTALGADEDLAP